jgi:MFS family permease
MIAFGQIPGAIIGGQVTDRLGRKVAIFTQNVCYIAGTLLSACAPSLSVFLCGQFVVGVGVAFSVTRYSLYHTHTHTVDSSFLFALSPHLLRPVLSVCVSSLYVISNISYVTEMVPPERTGALIALYELATTFGMKRIPTHNFMWLLQHFISFFFFLFFFPLFALSLSLLHG